MMALQKPWKFFISFSWFFPFLSKLSRFKRTNGSGIIYDVMNWFAYSCTCNFWNNSKTDLYYIMKLGQIIHNYKGIFRNLLFNLNSDGSLVTGPVFVFDNFIHEQELGSKEKMKLTFLRLFDNPLSIYLIFKRISFMQWLFCSIYQN